MIATTAKLVIPELPPSVNHLYVNKDVHYRDKNGKLKLRRMRCLSDQAQRWLDNTVVITNLWRNRTGWQTSKGKVIVRLWFYFPDARHGDTHNGLKVLMDAFEDARIYNNDKTALPRIMDYQIDKKNPRLEVEFEEMNL